MRKARSWRLLLPLAALGVVATIWVSGSFAAPQTNTIRVAIMTDCKGAFGFGYEPDIGGAQAALARLQRPIRPPGETTTMARKISPMIVLKLPPTTGISTSRT